MEEAPPELAAVKVDEQVGAQVPLDLEFEDQSGKTVHLKDLVDGQVPVILTFNYSSCPMLCSLMLDGLTNVLPQIAPMAAGELFKIITIVIDPSEPLDRTQKTRDRYLDKLQNLKDDLRKPAEEGGWTFLHAAKDGDDSAIQAVADAVGVRYHKVELPGGGTSVTGVQYAHPAVLVFLSPSGKVTRYVHGAQFDPDDIETSVARAAASEPSGAAGFVTRCFHYDPGAHSYTRTGLVVMKLTAAVFASMVFGGLVLAHLIRRNARK
jgi:protein SCO1/2